MAKCKALTGSAVKGLKPHFLNFLLPLPSVACWGSPPAIWLLSVWQLLAVVVLMSARNGQSSRLLKHHNIQCSYAYLLAVDIWSANIICPPRGKDERKDRHKMWNTAGEIQSVKCSNRVTEVERAADQYDLLRKQEMETHHVNQRK